MIKVQSLQSFKEKRVRIFGPIGQEYVMGVSRPWLNHCSFSNSLRMMYIIWPPVVMQIEICMSAIVPKKLFKETMQH